MIGGNTKAIIQTKTTTRNAIGESVVSWQDAQTLKGFLDLSGGDSRYNNYHAKVQESTHVFIADYAPLNGIKAENCRVLIDGLPYDVTLIDDPMGLHRHWEIYLRFTGGL